jgi:hypothetical protein
MRSRSAESRSRRGGRSDRPSARSARWLAGRVGVGAFAALCCTIGALAGCNTQRKQDCDKFLTAMAPMQGGAPSAETIDQVEGSVAAIQFEDEPLREYATNYKNTLTVLSNTLKLKATAGPDGPPDGTEDVIKQNLKEARTDFDDITRYCAP